MGIYVLCFINTFSCIYFLCMSNCRLSLCHFDQPNQVIFGTNLPSNSDKHVNQSQHSCKPQESQLMK